MGYNRLRYMAGEDGPDRYHGGPAGETHPAGARPVRIPTVSRVTTRWALDERCPVDSESALLRLLTQLANCGLAPASPPLLPLRRIYRWRW